jgi:hypothetical protein
MTDIWNINFDNKNIESNIINDIIQYAKASTKLLDLTKKTYSPYEKFIYDTAMFHFKRLNIEITENHFVEFWCKSTFETQKLHVDCDEYQKRENNKFIYPLLSCVSYFDDNNCPTIITNIDLEKYKYKDFESETEIFFSLPKYNKQITFDGSKYHGSCKLSERDDGRRYIIAFNLWDKKPKNVEYFLTDINDIDTNNKEIIVNVFPTTDEIKTINVCKKIINYSFFEDILYNNKNNSYYKFNDLISNDSNISSFKIILDTTKEKKELEIKLKNKYGNIMDDINELNQNQNIKYNRFLQRFTHRQLYTPEMCSYIINESEKFAANNGGWTTRRHVNYPTTDLPVDKIPAIIGLILETMKTVTNKIKTSYGLHDNMILNIQDLFIVKYEATSQNYLELHVDGSFLSFNILLSNTKEFEGGGTYFDDGLTSYSEQGDMLIHSSKIKHSGLAITKGKRYLLVGFLNIELNTELDKLLII